MITINNNPPAVGVDYTPAVTLETSVDAWPDPAPLPPTLPAVAAFDYTLLPDAWHDWIRDVANRMQCPPDYVAATALVMAGSLIGRKVGIRPKRHDDWTVVPNLFGMMIGRPSLLKSPSMKEALDFLAMLEIEAKAEYEKALADYTAAELIAQAELADAKTRLKKSIGEKDKEAAKAIANEMHTAAAEKPVRRRYMTHDATTEKYGMLVAENPNGLTMFADELIRWLRSLERDGHEADRGFYLTAWAGDLRCTYDRVGRGTLDIEAAIVSVVGSIQPGVISDYIRTAVSGAAGDGGLIQRFQLTVWPDAPAKWQNVDRYPDSEAKRRAHEALRRLVDLTPDSVHA